MAGHEKYHEILAVAQGGKIMIFTGFEKKAPHAPDLRRQ
jgi:hypothetical protein